MNQSNVIWCLILLEVAECSESFAVTRVADKRYNDEWTISVRKLRKGEHFHSCSVCCGWKMIFSNGSCSSRLRSQLLSEGNYCAKRYHTYEFESVHARYVDLSIFLLTTNYDTVSACCLHLFCFFEWSFALKLLRLLILDFPSVIFGCLVVSHHIAFEFKCPLVVQLK